MSGRLCLVAVALLFLARVGVGSAPADGGLYLTAYGALLRADPVSQAVSLCGRFHVTAPEAARDPDGRFWGRISPTAVGCIDPDTGREVGRVGLGDAPYQLAISEDGKAYISHTTLTRLGFSVSVVDTRRGSLVARIHGLAGLVTGLVAGNRQVYVTAVGVNDEDFLYLYRIDTATDSLEELCRVPKTRYVWRPALVGHMLYLVRVSGGGPEATTCVDLFDTAANRIAVAVRGDELGGIARFTGTAVEHGGLLYVPCTMSSGGPALAVLATAGGLRAVLPVQGGIAEIVGIREGILLYRDSLFTAGQEGISLFFHSLKDGKEVKRLRVLTCIEEARGADEKKVVGGAE